MNLNFSAEETENSDPQLHQPRFQETPGMKKAAKDFANSVTDLQKVMCSEYAHWIRTIISTMQESYVNAMREGYTSLVHETSNTKPLTNEDICYSCKNYARSPYLRCAVNPSGETSNCLDYLPADTSNPKSTNCI